MQRGSGHCKLFVHNHDNLRSAQRPLIVWTVSSITFVDGATWTDR